MVPTHRINSDNDYRSKYDWHDWPVGDKSGKGPTPGDIAECIYEGDDFGGADLAHLANVVCLRDWLDVVERSIVARIRLGLAEPDVDVDDPEAGYSWAQIGHALGITKQAAQQKFGEHVAREAARLAAEKAQTDTYEAYMAAVENDRA